MRLFPVPDSIVNSGERSFWMTYPFDLVIDVPVASTGVVSLEPVLSVIFDTSYLPSYITVGNGSRTYYHSESYITPDSGIMNTRLDDRFIYINYYRKLR